MYKDTDGNDFIFERQNNDNETNKKGDEILLCC